KVKVERLNKIAIAAMKQSLKAYLPKVNPAISLTQFFKEQEAVAIDKAIAHCVDTEKNYLAQAFKPQGKYLILIGPEGDFSEKEIAEALALGYQPISLGDSRLRTETAALMSCVEVSLLNR